MNSMATKSRPDSVELQVSSFKKMSAVIMFFDKHPLTTQIILTTSSCTSLVDVFYG
jgi:hypothetical protein